MPETNSYPEISELLNHRLVFVMGKGGAGKTTLAAALTFAAEAAGKTVLLAETVENMAIGRLFEKSEINEKPIPVSRHISIARILPKVEMVEYTKFHIKSGFIAKQITNSRLFDHIADAAPGLNEIMTLGKLWRWESEKHQNGKPLYDIIIVDSPATGHALNLLRLPEMLIDMIRVGPIVSQVKNLHVLLKDRTLSALVLVSPPEELPVKESVELSSIARDDLNMPVSMFFVNAVCPDLFSSLPHKLINDLLFSDQSGALDGVVSNPGAVDDVLKTARHQYLWRQIHQKHIDYIRNIVACPVVEIPFFAKADMTLRDIRQMANDCFLPSKDVRGTGHA